MMPYLLFIFCIIDQLLRFSLCQRCPTHLPIPLHEPMRGCKWVLEKDWDGCYELVTDCSFTGVFNNRTDTRHSRKWPSYTGIDRSNVCPNDLRCPACYDCLQNRFDDAKCVWNGRCCPRDQWVACASDPCADHQRVCPGSAYCIQSNCGSCSPIYFNKDLQEMNECSVPTECLLPLQQGKCTRKIPAYYYDSMRGRCERFIYTGCGGNDNRYASRSACINYCNDPRLVTGIRENNGRGRLSVIQTAQIDKIERENLPSEEVDGRRRGDCPMQRVYRKCSKELALDECLSDGQCPVGFKCCRSDCGEYTCREAVTGPTDVLPPDPFGFKPVTKTDTIDQFGGGTPTQAIDPNTLAMVCCKADRRITSACHPLCNYQISKRSVVQAYVEGRCPIAQAFQPGLTCLASGTSHELCCRKAGVHKVAGGKCMSFCNPESSFELSNQKQLLSCLGVIKTVVACFEQYARTKISATTFVN